MCYAINFRIIPLHIESVDWLKSVNLLVQPRDSLVLREVAWVLGGVSEEVIDFSEAEILAVVISFGHFT